MTSAVVAPVGAPVKPNRCLNLMNMLFAALPTVVFGVFTIIFTLQQNAAAQKNREQDQRQTDERNIRTTFENYIDDVSDFLLDRDFNRSNPDHLLHIRVKTLTVLRYLDANRRRDVILFLYDSRLLRSDFPQEQRLNLIGADLGDVRFVGTPAAFWDLSYLYLAGIHAPNLYFQWCHLSFAVFDKASIPNIKISNSMIPLAKFHQIYAPDITFTDLIFFGNDLSNSILHRIRFVGIVQVYGSVDFNNSDLYDPEMSHGEMINSSMLNSELIHIHNAHLPDGSWGPINESNLVQDPGGEELCLSNNGTLWLSTSRSMMSAVPVSNESRLSEIKNVGLCSFVTTAEISIIEQGILLDSFSVLIDSGRAAYNLSMQTGCFGEQSPHISVRILFFKDNLLLIDVNEKITTENSPRLWNSLVGTIPMGTRVVKLIIEASLSDSTKFCFFDNIHLNLFFKT